MAYGLQTFSANDAVNPIFDSTSSFGFIEIDSGVVPETGTASSSYNITVDDGYTDIFYAYTPENVAVVVGRIPTDGGFGLGGGADSDNSLVPVFTRGSVTNNGNGTKTFILTLTWKGQAGVDGDANRIGGGRVLIFGR